jgi:UDP-GlcNAc:undecaprenyl-phosphate/decaprenyl-phosphate GlcNAc-1-phosphate transferase
MEVSAAVTIAALPAAYLVIRALLRSPLGERLVAVPTSERWHGSPTPTFGGVGIFCGLMTGIAAAVAAGVIEPTTELLGIVCGCTVIFAAGFLDDVFHLSPFLKLLAQVVAAAIVIASGLRVELFANNIVAVAVALVWLVGITNAFNLLDNMDGLAATLATVACAYFAIDAAAVHGNKLVIVLALSLGFACAGFLPFNLRIGRNATVFMGDGGSQLLGFALASLGLAASWTAAGTTVATVMLPLIVLAIPILDTTLVTAVRILEGRPVTQGGRDHTSHRLVYYGLSELGAVALLATVAIALGATGLAYNVLDNGRITAVGVLISVVLLVQFGNFLAELREHSEENGPRPSLLHSLLAPRRLFEIVVDFALICSSFLAAYVIIVDGLGNLVERAWFLAALPVVLGTRYLCFVLGGVYRRVWRYATTTDELVVALACGVSAVLSWLIVVLLHGSFGLPPSVFLLDAIFATLLVGGARLAFRIWVERDDGAVAGAETSRVLIVGAGRFGRSFARETRETPGMRVVGFVDDNPSLRGRRIAGSRVLGPLHELERVIRQSEPTEVIVTIAEAPEERLAIVRAACSKTRVTCSLMHRRMEAVSLPTEVPAE